MVVTPSLPHTFTSLTSCPVVIAALTLVTVDPVLTTPTALGRSHRDVRVDKSKRLSHRVSQRWHTHARVHTPQESLCSARVKVSCDSECTRLANEKRQVCLVTCWSHDCYHGDLHRPWRQSLYAYVSKPRRRGRGQNERRRECYAHAKDIGKLVWRPHPPAHNHTEHCLWWGWWSLWLLLSVDWDCMH